MQKFKDIVVKKRWKNVEWTCYSFKEKDFFRYEFKIPVETFGDVGIFCEFCT